MTTYLAYIDDSGDETLAVYTALLLPIERWTEALTLWLSFRKNLYRDYGIPADFEIHCKDLIQAGKGRPAPGITYGVNTEASKRRRVLELANATIRSIPDLQVVAKVHAHVSPDHCYRTLLSEIDAQMAAGDSWALLVVDGDGSQPYQKAAHRDLKLANRRIVEDPWHQGSHASQFVQMADVAAYSVFQAHRLRESRRQLWGWMATYLHPKELPGCCACP